MARHFAWGYIVLLHWPFCVYLSSISYATIYDGQFDSDEGGIPAATPDDEDRALNVATFVIVVAAGFGTLTDLVDIVISLWVMGPNPKKGNLSLPGTLKGGADQTPSSPKPPPKSRYWIVVLRFIMIILWIAVLAWGLVPTDVLMYIDYDPADGTEGGFSPNYSDTVLGFIYLLLSLDLIGFIGPFIQRCVLFFFWRKSQQSNVEKTDGHREIGSVGPGQFKSAGSIPIGHTLSVEEV